MVVINGYIISCMLVILPLKDVKCQSHSRISLQLRYDFCISVYFIRIRGSSLPRKLRKSVVPSLGQ